ncbi:hypothetical protein Syun_009748 [Stephania yunnanensis]|uniref:Cation/H+ exchanger transmembrane domain-containing protein n=1 Tax=Stephania yunnanensis TaxID=152371 RepID=A0AAP0KHA2_9MAGN
MASSSGVNVRIEGVVNGIDHAQVVSVSLFVAVICFSIVVGRLLGKGRWLNESITAILIGCISGTVILLLSKGTSSHILRFDEDLFFIYLLPPIIYNAGLVSIISVKKKQFFQNFTTIMLFGVVGAFFSSAIISADLLTFGTRFYCLFLNAKNLFAQVSIADDTGSKWLFPKIGFSSLSAMDYLAIGTIFSSTDTVCTLQVLHQDETPLLYSLVFGEGVVNDATSVVLFNAIQKLDVSELNGWAAVHVLGDFFYLFSTSTVLGAAVGLMTSYVLKILYFGSLGTSVGICSTLIFLILIGRAVFIFPLSALSNYTNREAGCPSISFKHQVIIWWAGLMRGAVSVALAFNQFTYSGVTWSPTDATMINTTTIVVLFSTLVFGYLTKPLITFLLPHHTANTSPNTSEPGSQKQLYTPLHANNSFTMLLERPVYTIHNLWKKFDDTYMRPVFGGPHRG